MKDFKDKVAVITGAASGIGRGIANRAIKEHMKVVLADVEQNALSQTERELSALGGNVLSVLTDVSKSKDLDNLAQKTLDEFGEIHLLCNNAGVTVPGVSWEQSMEDWKWVMDVNLWGVINGIRTFIPIMIKQDCECHIINTASLSGLMAEEVLHAIYIVTKYGVVGLSEILSRELSLLNTKVKVSVLCPGMVKTRLMECERNRPADLCNIDEAIHHSELAQLEEVELNMADAGTFPDKVGDIVFEGMSNDLFYILTDTKLYFRRMIQNRMDRILNAYEENKLIHKSLEKRS